MNNKLVSDIIAPVTISFKGGKWHVYLRQEGVTLTYYTIGEVFMSLHKEYSFPF